MHVGRIWRKPPGTRSRVWQLQRVIDFPLQTLFKTQYEAKTFAFDFSTEGELIAGDTLSNPEVWLSPRDGIIQTGPFAINQSVFYDSAGGAEVQVGMGVTVQIWGGDPNATYTIYCRVQTSSGDVIEIQGQLQILPSVDVGTGS